MRWDLGGLWTVNSNGTDAVKILQYDGSNKSAIWSPDGRRIAVAFDAPNENWGGSDQRCIALIDSASVNLVLFGGEWQSLKMPSCAYQDFPRYWSTDGNWVVVYFSGSQDAGPGFYGLEVDGTRRIPLEQLGKIQMYDERYWPWKIIDSPVCKGASFWECE